MQVSRKPVCPRVKGRRRKTVNNVDLIEGHGPQTTSENKCAVVGVQARRFVVKQPACHWLT